ncbi:Alpha/Beta hydrolase protein [Jimgerdemannia flammicorona]|nr:Alpha/Beta hydrolase protein [Jimgerdemannia flammicorona]
MGGFGTWDLAITYPDRFAAAIPICGGGNTEHIDRIKNLPVWCFHGALDNTVPVQRSIDMVEALKKVGGNVKLTVYPNVKHDSWSQTYKNEEVINWMLQQKQE